MKEIARAVVDAARHQSLSAALAWSYDGLDPAAQQLFRRLGVLVGGGTLALVEAVADVPPCWSGVVVDSLTGLLDHSLVQRTWTADGQPRFSMLETVRAFALEHLNAVGEAQFVAARHAAQMLQLVQNATEQLHGPEQAVWLQRIDAELGNLQQNRRVDRGCTPRGKILLIGCHKRVSSWVFFSKTGE